MKLTNVEALLKEKGIEYIRKGNDALIKCIDPDHDDNSPSMRVDIETGKFNCFSCGCHGNIFLHFGEYQSPVYDLLYETKNKIADIMRSTRGMEIPAGAIPFEEEYRGISPATFRKFNAFLYGEEQYENRIIFPITDASGKILCFNGRHKFSNASPKYKFYPANAEVPIFPFVTGHDTLILVEGILDMINLYDKGITNVACTFGTHNLSFSNAYDKLLPYLIAGVRKFLILMDNDKAGRYAAKRMVDVISTKTKCRAIDISDMISGDDDPGSLNQKQVDKLAKRIENLFANA